MDTPIWQLDWSDDLSVGIPAIDAEHRHSILLINQLNEAIISRMDIEVIKKRMQAVMDDAASHFSHEEEMFRRWGYPQAEEHAQKHVQAIQFFQKIMSGFNRDTTEYEWIEAGLKVKQALTGHMLAEDMKYREYYLKKMSQAVIENDTRN